MGTTSRAKMAHPRPSIDSLTPPPEQKTHTVGHLKINISRKYIMLVFFSEKCEKSQYYAHELKFD